MNTEQLELDLAEVRQKIAASVAECNRLRERASELRGMRGMMARARTASSQADGLDLEINALRQQEAGIKRAIEGAGVWA